MEDQVDYTEPVEQFESMLPQEKVNTMMLQDLVTILDILELVKVQICDKELEKRLITLINRVNKKIQNKFDSTEKGEIP